MLSVVLTCCLLFKHVVCCFNMLSVVLTCCLLFKHVVCCFNMLPVVLTCCLLFQFRVTRYMLLQFRVVAYEIIEKINMNWLKKKKYDFELITTDMQMHELQ